MLTGANQLAHRLQTIALVKENRFGLLALILEVMRIKNLIFFDRRGLIVSEACCNSIIYSAWQPSRYEDGMMVPFSGARETVSSPVQMLGGREDLWTQPSHSPLCSSFCSTVLSL